MWLLNRYSYDGSTLHFCGQHTNETWRQQGLGNHSLFGIDPQLIGVDVSELRNISVREGSPAQVRLGFRNFEYGVQQMTGPTILNG